MPSDPSSGRWMESEHAKGPSSCHFRSHVLDDIDDAVDKSVSSHSSRLAASNVPSPDSIFPPGIDHIPLLGSFPLCTSSHRGFVVVVVVVVEEEGDLLTAGRHRTTTATAARGTTAGVSNDDDERERREDDDVAAFVLGSSDLIAADGVLGATTAMFENDIDTDIVTVRNMNMLIAMR